MTDRLSYNASVSLKGFFSILVILCHLRSYIMIVNNNWLPSKLFVSFGYISVGIFFFLSGYGLFISSQKKNYLNHFLRNRFFVLYYKYVVFIMLYTAYLFLGNVLEKKTLVISFFFGGTVVINGWFFQTTFVLYLLFFSIFRIFNKDHLRLIIIFVGLLLYTLVCIVLHFEEHWYQSVFCFCFGMVFCKYRNKLLLKSPLRYVLLIVAAICSIVLFLLKSVYSLNSVINIFVVNSLVISILFIVLYSPAIVLINNRLFRFVGKYSLGLYAFHGLFVSFFRSRIFFIPNDFLFAVIVIACSFLTAVIIHKLFGFIDKKIVWTAAQNGL